MSADDIARAIKKAADRIREGLADGLEDLSENILEEAQRIVPIEESTLSKSGMAITDREGLKATISFGSGAAAPYAVIQHEDTSFKHDEGRQSKYLEQPFVKISDDKGLDILADAVKRQK